MFIKNIKSSRDVLSIPIIQSCKSVLQNKPKNSSWKFFKLVLSRVWFFFCKKCFRITWKVCVVQTITVSMTLTTPSSFSYQFLSQNIKSSRDVFSIRNIKSCKSVLQKNRKFIVVKIFRIVLTSPAYNRRLSRCWFFQKIVKHVFTTHEKFVWSKQYLYWWG